MTGKRVFCSPPPDSSPTAVAVDMPWMNLWNDGALNSASYAAFAEHSVCNRIMSAKTERAERGVICELVSAGIPACMGFDPLIGTEIYQGRTGSHQGLCRWEQGTSELSVLPTLLLLLLFMQIPRRHPLVDLAQEPTRQHGRSPA
jgi:hypothetical protein